VSSLHMTDFVSGKGQFKDWRGETAKRKRFIDQAVACVKRNTNKGFATSVIVSEYEEINAKYRLAESAGAPYTICGMMAIAQVRDWAERKGTDPRKILYIFEDGDEDQGELIERSKVDGYKVIPLAKSEAQAFQAGDMAAWKAMAALREAEKKQKATSRDPQQNLESFTSIMRSLEPVMPVLHKNSVMTIDKLRLICGDYKIRPR
jgi:hypothetical protein